MRVLSRGPPQSTRVRSGESSSMRGVFLGGIGLSIAVQELNNLAQDC